MKNIKRKQKNLWTPYRIHLVIYALGAFSGLIPIFLLLILLVLLNNKVDWEKDVYDVIKLLIILWLFQLGTGFIADIFNYMNQALNNESFYNISYKVVSVCDVISKFSGYVVAIIMLIKGLIPVSHKSY